MKEELIIAIRVNKEDDIDNIKNQLDTYLYRIIREPIL
jgi:hypothetical protein